MNENERESIGRIEVAPEVMATIAHYATLRLEGVSKMASIPADAARLLRRATRHNGILLNIVEDKVTFDIYVIMHPHVNIMETSKNLQAAVSDAIVKMVGIPVTAVNVHVEDVIYGQSDVS